MWRVDISASHGPSFFTPHTQTHPPPALFQALSSPFEETIWRVDECSSRSDGEAVSPAEGALGSLWAVPLQTVCFSPPPCLCLSNLFFFHLALHASTSSWDESRSGKTGPFSHLHLFSSLFLSFSHISHTSTSSITPSTSTKPRCNGDPPAPPALVKISCKQQQTH